MRFLTVAACAALAAMTVSAVAADPKLPHRKPGLWQNDMVIDGAKKSNQQCFDDASETKMEALGLQHCSAHHVAHNADGSWTTTGTCEFQQGKTSTSTTTISGDFNSKLTMSSTMASGGPAPVITSTWTGPCKADQKGGDVIGPNGEKVNMIDVLSGHQPH